MIRHLVFIGLGSNSVSRFSQIYEAIAYLRSLLQEVECSSVYETAALNGKDASYANAVVMGETSLDVGRLTEILKQYEKDHGRTVASKKYGIVPIDLDIVICDDEVLRPEDMSRDYFKLGFLEIKGPVAE